jgi:hypothetical protein
MHKSDEGEMVCLTEVGDMGLGITKPQNDQEREALRKKLEEMTQATNDSNKRH